MINPFDNAKGIIIHDEKIGQGAIILNIKTEHPDNLKFNPLFYIKDNSELFELFDYSKIGFNKIMCEDYGTANLKNNVLTINSYSQDEYDDIGDGWKINYFKHNIYDQFGNNLSDYGFKFNLLNTDRRQKTNKMISYYHNSKL